MSPPAHKGAEEARNQLPELLTAAENGRSTVITKHGRPVAAIVPMTNFKDHSRQKPLQSIKGSGRGLWGEDSRRTLRTLRDEWKH
jgi:prevent-host-death family protein